MEKYNFKPFEKVLVRYNDSDYWHANIYYRYDEETKQHLCIGSSWKYCIPYKGNEHLLGTKDSPQPKRWRAKKNCEYYYINSRVEVFADIEECTVVDDEHFNIGNYFRTREEAEKVSEKFKEILK